MARPLKKYQEKRSFGTTAEPEGKGRTKKKGALFVIQKHNARSLHYDFRIEDEGVLKSWAIPKGPSTDPSKKKLAVMTENHPYQYKDFEGIIAPGNYGAGSVIIWDIGTYRNLKELPLKKCIANGEVALWLEGHKLKGGYALIRINKEKNDWIFFKMKDDYQDTKHSITKDEPESVISGLTTQELEEE